MPQEKPVDPLAVAKNELKLKDDTCKNIFNRRKTLKQQMTAEELYQTRDIPVDISSVLKLDAFTMNFGNFISGKMLGSTLELTNLTSQDQVFQLRIDSQCKHFSVKKVFMNEGKTELDTLPFN